MATRHGEHCLSLQTTLQYTTQNINCVIYKHRICVICYCCSLVTVTSQQNANTVLRTVCRVQVLVCLYYPVVMASHRMTDLAYVHSGYRLGSQQTQSYRTSSKFELQCSNIRKLLSTRKLNGKKIKPILRLKLTNCKNTDNIHTTNGLSYVHQCTSARPTQALFSESQQANFVRRQKQFL